VIHEGAVVRDSIIMTDSIIGPGTVIDRCVIDKQVVVNAYAQLGVGDDNTPNWLEPTRLNTGLCLVGRAARVPANVIAERNVLIAPDVKEADFEHLVFSSGETVDPRVPVWT
jgi:glucose-1-phosphate adenylyltransferase